MKKHWYTNDIEEAMFLEDQEPDGWHRGRIKMSDEQRSKLSKARIGKPAWNKGIPITEEARQKLSKSKQGKKQSLETRQKRSKALKGISRSLDTRQKMAKAKLGHIVSEETKEKIRQTKAKNKKPSKFKGIPRTIEVKAKISQTVTNAYKENGAAIIKASNETKRKNNSYSKSKDSEDVLNKFLIETFGKDAFIRQYRDDKRYPFNCDFYIPKLDLFIELNHYWSHGYHRFDINNKEDIKKLNCWQEKAKTSKHYEDAIEVWTIRDPKKFEFAEANRLNYLVSYNQQDLEKIQKYLKELGSSIV